MFNATLSFILASKETRIRKKVQNDVFMYYLKKRLWVSLDTLVIAEIQQNSCPPQ